MNAYTKGLPWCFGALLSAGVVLGATDATAQGTSNGTGAVLRGLDKLTDQAVDIKLGAGASATFGHIKITLHECRYPAGNPAGEAYANLTVHDINANEDAFSGWMVASSPALNALEHRRYDVWVLRCTTS